MSRPVTVIPHSAFSSLIDGVVLWCSQTHPSVVPQTIVVPSLPFGDQLQLRLADRLGVCMGFDFLMPQEFVHRAIGGEVRNDWSPQVLTWRILPWVRQFAGALGVSAPVVRDAFALAGMLADRFDQYGHFRPEIFRSWAVGKSALAPGASAAAKAAEEWQRELWGILASEDGVAPHPAVELHRKAADADFLRPLVAAYPRLLVLGTGSVDPLMVEVLGLLAGAGGEIEMHVVLPSLDFLGDLKRRGALPSAESDPEELECNAGHPLLESMGRHAVGSFLLLGRLDDQYTHWPEPDPRADGRADLLGALQQDIGTLRAPSQLADDGTDLSVRVHSCFGPRREMEVLRDELARAFRDLPDLQPEEVQIVATDMETYTPLVSAVLQCGANPLPVRLSKAARTGRDPVIEALLALLEMAREERFEASGILELLQLRAVQQGLGAEDDARALETLRSWICASGLTHGLGEGTGERAAVGTWKFAGNRLIAGRWFGREEEVTYPSGEYVLPIADQLGGSPQLRESFLAWVAGLRRIFGEWQVSASPGDWAGRLEQASLQLLAKENEALLALQPMLVFLRELACEEKIDAGTLGDWLDAESAEAGRRTQISGRIAFGRFKQLQNIPCRVLAMVGLRDGAFPGQSRSPAWDLLRASPRAWDRNPRVDDRQLFLDALLTPRDRLIITAPTRNVRSGKTEPFSSCVDELLRVAGAMGRGSDSLVVRHRLAPFADGYFCDGAGLPQSFDRAHAEVAVRLESGQRLPGIPFYVPGDHSSLDSDGCEVTSRQLIDFWKDPAKAFLLAQGITLPTQEADDVELDRAPLSLGSLQKWSVKNAVVKELTAAESGGLALTEARLRANRELPPGHLGTLAWSAERDRSEPLGRQVRVWAGEVLTVEVALSDRIRVTGHLRLTADGQSLFAYRIGEFKNAKHYLELWVQAVIAGAGGLALPMIVIDEADPEVAKNLGAIPQEGAIECLRGLVEGWREGQRRPLEYGPQTSDSYAKKVTKPDATSATMEEAVAAAKAAWEVEPHDYGCGEGADRAAAFVWRDCDPFERPDEWQRWGDAVAVPLRKWGGFS